MSEVAWFDGAGLRFLVKTAKDQIARGEKWNLGNRLVTRGETHVASRVAALRHLQTFSFSTAILIFPLLDIFLIQRRLHTVRVHKRADSRQGLVWSFLLSALSHRYIWRFYAFLVGGCSVFFFFFFFYNTRVASGVKSVCTDSFSRTGISIFVSLSVPWSFLLSHTSDARKLLNILFFLQRFNSLIACFVTVDKTSRRLATEGRRINRCW